jgi:phenylalanyl-tRNA synthetase beta subunit
MHAFDEDFIRGGRIVVRRAKKDEVIITLDEQE